MINFLKKVYGSLGVVGNALIFIIMLSSFIGLMTSGTITINYDGDSSLWFVVSSIVNILSGVSFMVLSFTISWENLYKHFKGKKK